MINRVIGFMNKNVKKSILSALIILALLLFTTSNYDGKPGISNSENTDNLQIEINITNDFNTRDIYNSSCRTDSTICVNSRYFKSSFSENKSFSFRNKDVFWVTSLIVNDEQLLSGVFLNQETTNSFNEKMAERIQIHNDILKSSNSYYIRATEYYGEDSTGYYNLTDEDILFISNKEHNPVVTKVTYTDYDKSEKIPKNNWIDAFEKEIEKQYGKKFNSPIIIRESWSFKHGNLQVDIVNASNIIVDAYNIPLINQTDISTNYSLPVGDHTIAYKMTLIFIDGNTANINTKLKKLTYIETLSSDLFVFPENGETALGGYYTYQYDEKGNTILVPLYLLHDYSMREFCYWPSFLFADVDTDGNGELVYLYDYGPKFFAHDTITGYELTEKHELHKKLICPKI